MYFSFFKSLKKTSEVWTCIMNFNTSVLQTKPAKPDVCFCYWFVTIAFSPDHFTVNANILKVNVSPWFNVTSFILFNLPVHKLFKLQMVGFIKPYQLCSILLSIHATQALRSVPWMLQWLLATVDHYLQTEKKKTWPDIFQKCNSKTQLMLFYITEAKKPPPVYLVFVQF